MTKTGYFDVFKSSTKSASEKSLILNSTLKSKSTSGTVASTTFSSSTEGVTTVSGATVTIPANGLKNATTGEAFTGTATMETFYLSPENENFSELMPGGDLAAITSSEESVILISYGMMNVNLSDGAGTKLQIADGTTATVRFPIAASQQTGAPATMPLWSFDQTKGVWVEEGVATKSQDGTYYEGSVTHFSWVNLDYPESRATVKGTVTDASGAPLSGVKVIIEQVNRITNQQGQYSAFVPANTPITVSIKATDYYNQSITPQNVAALNGGDEATVNFTVPTMPKVTGTVSSCTSTTGEEANIILSYYDYTAYKTVSIATKTTNGSFAIPVGSNVSYIDITAYRGGNYGEKSASGTAGQNIDAGNIQVCTSIPVGNNKITLTGGTYVNQVFVLDGERTAQLSQEGDMYSFLNISQSSKEVFENQYNTIEPRNNCWVNLQNITSTGTYTYAAQQDQQGFSVYVTLSDKTYNLVSGSVHVTQVGPVGGLVEGTVTGVIESNDQTESYTATINFSVLRNPDSSWGTGRFQ